MACVKDTKSMEKWLFKRVMAQAVRFLLLHKSLTIVDHEKDSRLSYTQANSAGTHSCKYYRYVLSVFLFSILVLENITATRLPHLLPSAFKSPNILAGPTEQNEFRSTIPLPPSAPQITKRSWHYNYEFITLPRGWIAAIRTTTMFLPVTAACAALEEFYGQILALLPEMDSDHMSVIQGSGSGLASVFRLGELRLVTQLHVQDQVLWQEVLQALIRKLLEWAGNGRAVAWEGVLLQAGHEDDPQDSGALLTMAVGTPAMWEGWQQIQR
ncbi:MAG: hypothetical protein Q9181_002512 [Wetmoreana brouardii]